MYYAYILQSEVTKKLYLGYTNDLRARVQEHDRGQSTATKLYAPWKLIYYEAYRSKRDAITREKQLKRYKQGYSRLKERIKNSLEGQN